MSDETIVAIYDAPAHAELAAADLRQAGVPENAINLHTETAPGGSTDMTSTTASAPREPGFWSNLFGGSPDHDTSVYDRSVESGASVLTVKTPEEHIARVTEILESHHPIDIDDRAATYGSSQGVASAPATMRQAEPSPMASSMPATGPKPAASAARDTDGRMQLSEESLAIGNRVVNRGGTRIRRFVVERPVEENVTLHSENVVVDRHPVTDARTVADSFSDKTIEMTETAEEAVVSKSARVYEEVGLRKEASDRNETVKGTVRKEEAKIETIPGSAQPASKSDTTAPRNPPK